jgi:hypothetical protein
MEVSDAGVMDAGPKPCKPYAARRGGRDPEPSVAILDSRSIKSAQKGGNTVMNAGQKT